MPKRRECDVAVIGGGPAGMMCAGTAARAGAKVLLIERNGITGKKLMITGKGRCNITNHCDIDTLMANIPVNSRFLHSAFSAFGPADTMAFFEKRGVPLKTERGGRVFPISDRAADIAGALRRYAEESGTIIIKDRAEHILTQDGRVTGVACRENFISCTRAVIATGGVSYPATGSTGDGYRMAEETGHDIIPARGSLVPFEIKQDLCRKCQGLTLKNVRLRLLENDIEIFSDFGELLFTHFGLSGPLVLSASAHVRKPKCKYAVEIDLKPALDEQTLDKRLLREFDTYGKRDYVNVLRELLPSKLVEPFALLTGIPTDMKTSLITKEQRKNIIACLKCLQLDITALRPVEEAIITTGGVATSCITPKTMESKKAAGLYFAGEVIDVDAYTGGFNLQIALSTGYAAGTYAGNGR